MKLDIQSFTPQHNGSMDIPAYNDDDDSKYDEEEQQDDPWAVSDLVDNSIPWSGE